MKVKIGTEAAQFPEWNTFSLQCLAHGVPSSWDSSLKVLLTLSKSSVGLAALLAPLSAIFLSSFLPPAIPKSSAICFFSAPPFPDQRAWHSMGNPVEYTTREHFRASKLFLVWHDDQSLVPGSQCLPFWLRLPSPSQQSRSRFSLPPSRSLVLLIMPWVRLKITQFSPNSPGACRLKNSPITLAQHSRGTTADLPQLFFHSLFYCCHQSVTSLSSWFFSFIVRLNA